MNADDKAANNLEVFMENGPRMSTRYQTWVIARDRKNKWVLLDGLGCMGCGRMWVRDDGSHADDPEYANAPERDSTGQFGTQPLRLWVRDAPPEGNAIRGILIALPIGIALWFVIGLALLAVRG